MELDDAILRRRTVHTFNSKKVPDRLIEKAILAANQAPCHKRTFPWRFINVSDLKRQQIFEIYLASIALISNEALDERKMHDKIFNPSHLIIPLQSISSNPIRRKEDYAACACAIQNLSLSLVAENVYCKWSTSSITNTQQIYDAFGINKQNEEVIGFLYIGYGVVPSAVNRPSLPEIFRTI